MLIPAFLLRVDAELGYRWQAWFNDSFEYVQNTVHFQLDPTRISGYSVWLKILQPFHSYALVTILQHLMGLAVAVMIYALARHRFGVPAWLAALATVPVLYDGFEIELEHLIMADVPFLFLLTLATTLLLWDRSGPSTRMCAVIGGLLGLGAVLRSIGLPLLAVFAVYMIIRRFSWRKVAAAVVVCLIPVVGYAGIFDLEHGQFAMSDATGVFLYSRVMGFAECSKMHVPANRARAVHGSSAGQAAVSYAVVHLGCGHPARSLPAVEVLPGAQRAGEAVRHPRHRGAAAELRQGGVRRHLAGVRLEAHRVPQRPNVRRVQIRLPLRADPGLGYAELGRYSSYAAAYVRGNPLTQVVAPFANIIRG